MGWIDKRIKPSQITPEEVFVNRRQIVKSAVALGLIPGLASESFAAALPTDGDRLENVSRWPGSLDEEPNSFEDVSTFNNFYEFGTRKEDPSRYAHRMKTDP